MFKIKNYPINQNFFFYFAILLSLFIGLHLLISGNVVIKITLFEIVVPIIFIITLLQNKDRQNYHIFLSPGLLLVYILAFTILIAFIYGILMGLAKSNLIRESLKHLGSYANILMLSFIFIKLNAYYVLNTSKHINIIFISAIFILSIFLSPTLLGEYSLFSYMRQFGVTYLTILTVIGHFICLYAIIHLNEEKNWKNKTTLLILLLSLISEYFLGRKIFLMFTCYLTITYAINAYSFNKNIFIKNKYTFAALIIILSIVLVYIVNTCGFLNSLNSRMHTGTLALELYANHPLSGIGLGQFSIYATGNPSIAGNVLFIHNQFLSFIAEMGVLGIFQCFVLVLLILYTRKAWVKNLQIPYLLLMFLTFFNHDAMSFRTIQIFFAYSIVKIFATNPQIFHFNASQFYKNFFFNNRG